MTLPAPNLDDRRFQDLVDDCKRLVQQRCPEWTDHNVSDPGVTLIETFAMLTDQLLYRLNRVPDRHYVKFLELLGIELFPPNAARTEVTHWLSAPREEVLRVPRGTQVATPRSGRSEPVVFTSVVDLDIIPCSLGPTLSSIGEGPMRDHTATVAKATPFFCFDQPPKPDDCLYVGLSDAVPSCVVSLRFQSDIEGTGVDPDRPPLVWEAWDGGTWARCDLDRDETGGLNRDGDIVLHLPATHVASLLERQRAGWVRARVVSAEDGTPAYSASPEIARLEAFTIGGSVESVHADLATNDVLGVTEGAPGQRFSLARSPVVPGDEPLVVEVSEGDGWQRWTAVEEWSGSGPEDRHVHLDAALGVVSFGPAVRLADGTLRRFGRTPPAGCGVRVPEYRVGGGSKGNVARHSLTQKKSSIPFIRGVDNRRAASGGRDGETVDNAKLRGPISLRSRLRAVTAEDFEHIALAAALEIARVRAIPDGSGAGVRVLLVPHATEDLGRLDFVQMVPDDDVAAKVVKVLEERRTIGTRVVVEPPEYMGVTVVARLRPHPTAEPGAVRLAALEALFNWFHPLRGGPDGDGWPFGRPVVAGEVYAVLHGVPGLGITEDVRLFAANPVTVERAKEPVQRIDLAPNQLVFSVDHQVAVL